MIDIFPIDGSDPVESANAIIGELEKYSPELASRERWLVLNKIDLIPENELQERADQIVKSLNWTGPVFLISAVTKKGTDQLKFDLMEAIEAGTRYQE